MAFPAVEENLSKDSHIATGLSIPATASGTGSGATMGASTTGDGDTARIASALVTRVTTNTDCRPASGGCVKHEWAFLNFRLFTYCQAS